MKVGILGAGNIARKMARTLKAMENSGDRSLSEICYAVASRDLDKARAFADEYGIRHAYGSYEEMVSDPEIDLIYVATPHSLHHEHTRLALEHGRNVLCEKAFMMSAEEARDVITLAREKGLLVAEAAWPRYMPFSLKIRQLLDSGIIGKTFSLSASMGYAEMHVDRVQRPELGGGALLDLGVYPIHFAMLCFGPEIAAVKSHATITPSGVDSQDFILLEFKDGRQAQLHATAVAYGEQIGIVNGDEGCMIVDSISHPRHIKVCDASHRILAEYDAPEEITGFEYQVLACKEAIENGWVECPALPHSEMISIMELTDSLLKEWGVSLAPRKNKYDLVIFDLDGTLINTIDDLGTAVNHALEERGLPLHTMEEYTSMVGHGVRNLVKAALPSDMRDDDAKVDSALASFVDYYKSHIDVHTHPYAGMQELLRSLSHAGVKLAVASNKFQSGTETLIRKFFGDIPFVAVFGNMEGAPLKPDAALVRRIVSIAFPEGGEHDVVLVGDSDTDMKTAANAGIPAVAVTWGFRSREELTAAGATVFVDTAGQLASALL